MHSLTAAGELESLGYSAVVPDVGGDVFGGREPSRRHYDDHRHRHPQPVDAYGRRDCCEPRRLAQHGDVSSESGQLHAVIDSRSGRRIYKPARYSIPPVVRFCQRCELAAASAGASSRQAPSSTSASRCAGECVGDVPTRLRHTPISSAAPARAGGTRPPADSGVAAMPDRPLSRGWQQSTASRRRQSRLYQARLCYTLEQLHLPQRIGQTARLNRVSAGLSGRYHSRNWRRLHMPSADSVPTCPAVASILAGSDQRRHRPPRRSSAACLHSASPFVHRHLQHQGCFPTLPYCRRATVMLYYMQCVVLQINVAAAAHPRVRYDPADSSAAVGMPRSAARHRLSSAIDMAVTSCTTSGGFGLHHHGRRSATAVPRRCVVCGHGHAASSPEQLKLAQPALSGRPPDEALGAASSRSLIIHVIVEHKAVVRPSTIPASCLPLAPPA